MVSPTRGRLPLWFNLFRGWPNCAFDRILTMEDLSTGFAQPVRRLGRGFRACRCYACLGPLEFWIKMFFCSIWSKSGDNGFRQEKTSAAKHILIGKTFFVLSELADEVVDAQNARRPYSKCYYLVVHRGASAMRLVSRAIPIESSYYFHLNVDVLVTSNLLPGLLLST